MERSAVLKSKRRAHEKLDGVRVTQAPGLGDVLVATRSFGVGDVALLEMPLLVFSSQKQLVKQYLRLSPEDKARVLDVRHVDLPSGEVPRYAQCCKYAAQVLDGFAELHAQFKHAISEPELANLLSVSVFNAYAYDMAGQIYSELDVVTMPQVAIFHLGSKLAPSCDPNILYTSSVYPGFGAFVVLKPIAEGEMLTMCSHDASHPTVARRQRMLSTRDYFCECARCTGPDRVSGMGCERPGCTGTKFGYHKSPNDNMLRDWQCDTCGDTATPNLALLEHYRKKSNFGMEAWLNAPSSLSLMVRELEDTAQEVQRVLSPTHFLLIELYDHIRLPLRHQAITLQEQGEQRKSEIYRVRAAEYGVKLMKIMECVSVGCTKGLTCTEQHPPSLTDPVPMLWIGMDLLRTSLKAREQYFPFVERYMPYMFSAYGHDDDDVCAVQAMLQEWRSRVGQDSEAALPAPEAAVEGNDRAVQELASAVDEWLIDTPVGQRAPSSRNSGGKKKSKPKRRGRK
jgi:hypothetical protein